MKAKALNILTLITLLSLMCVTGRAQLIYSNNFSLGSAVTLHGTAPAVANSVAGGTNTATWNVLSNSATAFMDANGTIGGAQNTGLLPFTPQTNHVYALTASVTFTNNPGSWIDLGFAGHYPAQNTGSAKMTDTSASGPDGYDWFIAQPTTATEQFFAGGGTAVAVGNQNLVYNTSYPGTWTLQVVLNTLGAKWAIAAFVNGTQLGTNYTYATNPAIVGAALGNNTLTVPTSVQWNYLSLSLLLQPFIITQPTSQGLSAGAAYTNSVTAQVDANGGALSYQWYTNGVPLNNGGAISGATSSSLVINPISTNNASTNYYVIVSNSSGSVTSSVASLTVLQTPQFISSIPTAYTNPITLFAGMTVNGTNYVGSTPAFSVSVVGAPPVSYQWLTNGVAVAGATSTNFTITNCQFSSPSSIACIAANSYGAATNTWSVAYISTPSAPYPQAVLADQPTAFWRLNEAGGSLCHDYQSANDGIYTNVTLGQPGYNPAETAETSAAFALQPNPLYSYAGRIRGIDFAATNGANAEFSVEAWAQGFGDVPNSPVVSEGTNGVSEEFGLGSSTNSSTLYQFYVRAANGTVYKAVSNVPVNDTEWHHLVGVCDEANGTVSLYVDGQLAASVSIPARSGIYEASSPLAIGAGLVTGSSDYTLEFNGNAADVSTYNYALSYAQVINHYASFGNAVSVSIAAPLPPATVVYQANQTLTIPVTISGAGPLGYYWLNVTTGSVISSGNMSASGGLNATLTIPNAPAGLGGDQLELVATNATSSANLNVSLFCPAPPVTLDYSSPVLYSNYFNGGTWSIAGMPLTAANSLAGGTNTTWINALGTNDTGIVQAGGVDASTAQDSWTVPFTPHSGYVYTMNASLTFSGNPGNWVGLGFAQRTLPVLTPYGTFNYANGLNGFNWLIMSESSGNVEYFAGPNTGGVITNKNAFFPAGTGTHTVQVVLDTTGASWVAYGYVDGVSTGTNIYSSNPSIGAVGFTQNGLTAPGNVQWNYFALSQMAPGGVPPYLITPLPTNNIPLTTGTISLSATAFGSAPFGYYWSNNSTIIASGSTNNMAPLPVDISIPGGNLSAGQLELVLTNAYGTNISVITLTSAVNPNPGAIQYSVTGNQLTLSWPTNLGWTLQSQTNSLAVGISTNWVNVANSSTTNQMSMPVNTANGSVFYRLVLP